MDDLGRALRFEVLGPLRVWIDDRPVALGPVQQRVVLSVLLFHANRPLGRDQIIDAVWGTNPPTFAVNLLQKHVSGLRRVLDPARSGLLVWTDAGYLLTVPAGALDASVFDRELDRARTARASGDLPGASAALNAALALWRGPVCDGLASPSLDAERQRHAERRVGALEERIEVDLALGRASQLVSELRQVTAEHPLRERLRELLMLALYRSGRQADALAVYHDTRRHLGEELGIEPSAGLQRLHQQILAADPAVQPAVQPAVGLAADEHRPAPAVPTPAQLPFGVGDFTGREGELENLDTMLKAAGDAVVIAMITGTAGVGKTALAVHWAHRVRDRFPDGQLYVNLRGFDPAGTAMEPEEAMRGFLDAVAVPPDRVPVTLDAQAALYRSLLAGKRVLVVLDNARDAGQVRPLLPSSPGCLVVVTSRSQLPGLVAAQHAKPLTVGLLSTAEAADLLAGRLGPARMAAEPDAVADIIASCARLPLALTVVAGRAATHPTFPLGVLAHQLRDSLARLDAFDSGDVSTDVRAVFSWSYQTLSPTAARMFRLIGLHRGPDIDLIAAASLAGVAVAGARRALTELERDHLVTEHSPARFTVHDLLRAYAAEQAEALDTGADRRAAVHRLLDHYLHSAHAAALLLDPHRYPVAPEPPEPWVLPVLPRDQEEAFGWFTAERATVIAAIHQALRDGFGRHAWQLACMLPTYLDRRGHWSELAATMRVALDAATALGDRTGEAITNRGLARAYGRLARYAEAGHHLERALGLFEQADDAVGRAGTHLALATLFERQHRYAEALEQSELALALCLANGHRQGQARSLTAAGSHHAHLGDYERASAYCEQALALLLEIGDRSGAAGAFTSLGYTLHRLGDHRRAIEHYERALDLRREMSDRYNEADTLTRLGEAHLAAGDPTAACAAWVAALDILEQLRHPDADEVRARIRRRS
jgi:DNA-binding SARP family transcriptional activator/tetratricopeptide (TPR) repeat protein